MWGKGQESSGAGVSESNRHGNGTSQEECNPADKLVLDSDLWSVRRIKVLYYVTKLVAI